MTESYLQMKLQNLSFIAKYKEKDSVEKFSQLLRGMLLYYEERGSTLESRSSITPSFLFILSFPLYFFTYLFLSFLSHCYFLCYIYTSLPIRFCDPAFLIWLRI